MSRTFFKALSLFLILCLGHAFAVAGSRIPESSGANTTKDISQKRILCGRLEVPLRQTILVNGLSSQSGDTIVSGARLQTSFIAAIVEVPLAARILVDAESDVVITFDDKAIEVNVSKGSADLRTAPGVTGKVIMPDHKEYPSTLMGSEKGNLLPGKSGKSNPWLDLLKDTGIAAALAALFHWLDKKGDDEDNKNCVLIIHYFDKSASPTRPPSDAFKTLTCGSRYDDGNISIQVSLNPTQIYVPYP